jgi:hypothetical protein
VIREPDPKALWPKLARVILAAAPGSPLDREASADEQIGAPTLLKVRGGEGCWRIPIHSAALAGVLSKGLSWSLPHPPVRKPTLTGGAWTLSRRRADPGGHGVWRDGGAASGAVSRQIVWRTLEWIS